MFRDRKTPYVIAEMSGNHNQSIDRALAIIDAAAAAGAHAVKLQTYTPDTITIDHDKGLFFIEEPSSLWKGQKLYDLYVEAMTPWEWHAELFEHARSRGMDIFSSPFDESAVEFLEQLNVSCYKIASFENNHFPLLRKVAQTGKPVILSTGASTLDEITLAVKTLRENGCSDLTLLKCTSTYPSKASNSNILTIPVMRELFQCQVGLSDHTGGVGVAVAAVALGAVVIEKHFTLDRSEGGVDSAFSLEPHELKLLVDETARAHEALGSVFFGILPEELKSLQYKRSIYAVKDIAKGEKLTPENIRIIRPGGGLSPAHWETVLGASAAQAIQRGEPVTWSTLLKQ